jgi:hypothetical protein
MKRIFKFIIPSIIAVIIIIPSLVLHIPSRVKFTVEADALSFSIIQNGTGLGTQASTTVIHDSNIEFISFIINRLDFDNFSNVQLSEFDILLYSPKNKSLNKLRENAKIKISPRSDRWRRLSRLSLRAEKDAVFSVQSAQTATKSTFEIQFESENKLLFQVDEGVNSQLNNHNPIFKITRTELMQVNTNGCIVSEIGSENGIIIEELSNTSYSDFFIKPSSEFSIITCEGENGRISLEASFHNDQFKNFSRVEMYDPEINEWKDGLNPIPTPRQNTVTAVVHDKIYVIGGDQRDTGLILLDDIGAENLEFKAIKNSKINVNHLHVLYENGEREVFEAMKALLILDPQKYNISRILANKDRIICSFNGSTKNVKLKTNGRNTILSLYLLEWLYKNQFLAMVFGAISWLVGTIYVAIKEWRGIQARKDKHLTKI